MVDALPERFTRHDFREQSHLNLTGAERFTRALARELVLPALRAKQHGAG